MPRLIEICLTDPASAIAAAEGGADRIELCADLDSGGVTPSAGLMAVVIEHSSIPVHVLLRPRAGDFVYRSSDISIMLHDIDVARSIGAAGVVLGALRDDMRVDIAETARLADRARPMSVTFHRAIDLTPDPLEAIDLLIALGIDRVLSSGGRGPAREGAATLRGMVARASGRLIVMAGGGIVASDLPGLLDATGVDEVHLASGVSGPRPAGGPFGREPARAEASRVAEVVARVRGENRDQSGSFAYNVP